MPFRPFGDAGSACFIRLKFAFTRQVKSLPLFSGMKENNTRVCAAAITGTALLNLPLFFPESGVLLAVQNLPS